MPTSLRDRLATFFQQGQESGAKGAMAGRSEDPLEQLLKLGYFNLATQRQEELGEERTIRKEERDLAREQKLDEKFQAEVNKLTERLQKAGVPGAIAKSRALEQAIPGIFSSSREDIKIPGVGTIGNVMGKDIPNIPGAELAQRFLTPGSTQVQQALEDYEAPYRHGLFGTALTPSESQKQLLGRGRAVGGQDVDVLRGARALREGYEADLTNILAGARPEVVSEVSKQLNLDLPTAFSLKSFAPQQPTDPLNKVLTPQQPKTFERDLPVVTPEPVAGAPAPITTPQAPAVDPDKARLEQLRNKYKKSF